MFYKRSNERIIASTRITRLLLSLLLPTPSSPLIDLMVRFLCGESSRQPILFQVLLSRVNCNSNDVSIATMQLFDMLLRSQHPLVVRALLPAPPSLQAPQSDLLSVFARQFRMALPKIDRFLKETADGATQNVQNDVEHEFALAQQYRKGREPSAAAGGSEGFLRVLLTRVRMFLRQSMEVNLEVTRLVSTLAVIASPELFAMLFLERESLSLVTEFDVVCIVALSDH